jgi:iron complex outermembrane receptor protein
MKTRALMLGASTLTMVWCGMAADAQTVSSGSGTTIETVTVTAERRNENLMTTPITADVLSGDDLKNRDAINVNDLQFIAPSVTINDFGQGVDFDIRGVGKGEHNTQTPIGVVIYQDSASTPPGYLDGEPFFDTKSVEVYRGPQGTFVGQNATGGAVFITSNDPEIGGGYDGYAQAQYGNYNNVELQGAVNVPVTDDFAMRVAGYAMYHSSWYSMTDTDPADNCPHQKYAGCQPGYNVPDNKWGAARISALWTPNQALTVSFKADADYQDYGARPAIPYTELYPVGALVAPFGPVGYTAAVNTYHNTNLFHVTANAPESAMDRFMRGILKVDYVLPDGIKLQSVSEVIAGNTQWMTDGDLTSYGDVGVYPFFGSPATTASWLAGTKNDQFYDRASEDVFTQEFNVVSPDNQRITWVVGVYGQENNYIWDKPYEFWGSYGSRFGNSLNIANFTPTAANFFQYESYTFEGHTSNLDIAAFGQVEAKLGGGLQASLGGRWTETRSNNFGPYWYFGTLYTLTAGAQKSYNFSYKAALDWAINDGNFLYGFVATGYTGGGLNLILSGSAPKSFGPVTDINYEVGWKTTDWFDGHVHTELDAYYTTYDHFQVALENPTIPNTTDEFNLPQSTINYGFEGEIQATFGQFSFTSALGLLRSQLGNYYLGDPRYNNTTFGTCDISPTGSHTNPACVDVKGHQMTYAPSATFNLSAQYVFNLASGDTLTPRLSYAHTSGQWATLFDNAALGDKLNPRDLLGGQLAWQTGTWILSLYGENLTDEQYVSANDSGGLYAGPPRTFGIRVNKVF